MSYCIYTTKSIFKTNKTEQIMAKLFLVSFLGLLIAAYGVAGNVVYDKFNILEELEDMDIAEDTDFLESPSWTSEHGGKVLVNVDSFGAVGDGVSDDTQVYIYYILFPTPSNYLYGSFRTH